MTRTISSTYNSRVILSGAFDNPATIATTGLLNAGLSGDVAGDPWTIANAGSIDGGVFFGSGSGVTNQASGNITGGPSAVYGGSGGLTVVNAGKIAADPANSLGVDLRAGGTVINLSGGSISGGRSGISGSGSAVTVLNTGYISANTLFGAGIDLQSGGSITNQSGGTITGHYGILGHRADTFTSTMNVVNAGVISGQSDGFISGAGIELGPQGSVTNLSGGTISSVSGYALTVVNAGGIGGIFATGGILTNLSGGSIGGIHGVDRATNVVNAGEIGGTSATRMGVYLDHGGAVINLAGASINGSSGVYASDYRDFSNANSPVTVVNAGSISGGLYAVRLGRGFYNRVIIDPNAVFTGLVSGGKPYGSFHLNTLELASGASAGTLTSLGTQFINFSSIAFDTGANWFVSGNTAGLAGDITGFTRGDTIEVTGITVIGSSYTGGVLTLTEASGSAALNLPGGFQASDFVVKNVAAGAQITVGRTLDWAGNGGSAAFASAANWNDVSNGLTPAQSSPGALDTALFNDGNGGVSGTGTAAALLVGAGGTGMLQLSNGATISTGSLDAGVAAGDVGQIGLTGSGTKLTVTGVATVADDGTGVLSVLAGATFAASDLTIGAKGNSSGALVVSGVGSEINLAGALNIGTALGVGDLTVGPGAAVHAEVVNLQGQVVLEGGLLDPTVTLINQGQTAGGFGTIAADAIIDKGMIEADTAKLVVQGTVLGGGTLAVNGTVQGASPAGILRLDGGGTMELTGPVLNDVTATFADDLAGPGTYTVNNRAVDVIFADGTGVLVLDDISGFAGTIATAQHGDSFVISGGTLSGLGVTNGNTLTFADSGARARTGGIDQIIFAQAVTAADFAIVNNETVQMACFAAGTRIEIENGPVPVEGLVVGDVAITIEGARETIVWIGKRLVDARAHPIPDSVWPVRVRAGAFGDGRPVRDLYLSPDHAVFVNHVLVPVKLLINGTSIVQVRRDRTRYFHIELSRHAVILAEGLPVESYLDTGDRSNFENGGNVTRLFPELSTPSFDTATLWETKACAPLVIHGPGLAAVRENIRTSGVYAASA